MASARTYEVTFFTATILEWKQLLANDSYKDVVISSLRSLVEQNRVMVHAFVIMHNHIHLLWHPSHPHNHGRVQNSLLGFTARKMIHDLQQTDATLLQEFYVGAVDRRCQIWERNPLSVELWAEDVVKQKLNYIHQNPVRKGWCTYAEEYKYSTAGIYMGMPNEWDFVSPIYF
jgi:REP element-mobilizing transposase RayT